MKQEESKKNIILLQGGVSPEREISLKSANAVGSALEELGYQVITMDPADYLSNTELVTRIKQNEPSTVFIALHGGDGENGVLQALLSSEQIRFTGSGYEASCLAMNKYVTSLIASDCGVPTPKQMSINSGEIIDVDFIESEIKLPLIVKPNDAGSSVGIYKVESKKELSNSINAAAEFSKRVIVQEYIPGRELTVTILNGEALPVVEIKPLSGWYDYQNKYTGGKTEYIVPAKLSEEETLLICDYAERIYSALGCTNYARVDFRFDGKTFYFLEVNTLPGMTSLSLVPMAAAQAGLTFNMLIEKILKNI
ncbi:MAG: D-alanine--D-alanine ligase [Candidatus Cloacimonetes bacterium]|nr:D-alanine--D-alanine ligase [Candidatus Cloacimonadota bacterium]